MIPTFDAKSYTDLLVRYQPKPIATEAENDAAIAIAQALEHRSQRTPEEDLFLELLITLIEKFEVDNYPIPTGSRSSMVQHLLEARDLHEAELISILGTKVAVTEVIDGKRKIQPDEAKKLANFFQVDASLFLET